MEQKNWFIEERAKALATIYVTHRDDLTLSRESEGVGGVDYVVDIKGREHVVYRRFGFFLYGSLKRFKKADADKLLSLKLRHWQCEKAFPYPVCLLLFSVVDNKGYYTWLAEPVVEGSAPRLRHLKESSARPLTRSSLDRVVDAVNSWYDAFYATVIV